MENITEYRMKSKAFMSLLIVFTLVFSLFSSIAAKSAEAKASARAAVVVTVKGDVSVKKAGGSKSYSAYEDMSLNQGDYISTGSGAAVTLRVADRQDEITVGENSEFYISDLAEQGGGTVSKFKMWAGSAWTKVKSLVSSDDEFEMETPTAVMGVRGTQLGVNINPETGGSSTLVGSGIVTATTTTNQAAPDGQSTQTSQDVTVYPTQQFSMGSRDEVTDLRASVNTVDVNNFVQNASPDIVNSFIQGASDMQAENNQIMNNLSANAQNGTTPPGNTTLNLSDPNALSQFSSNINGLIPNFAQSAVNSGAVPQSTIDQLNSTLPPGQQVDLNNVTPLDPNAGVDPAVAQIVQEQQANKAAAAERTGQEQQQVTAAQQNMPNLVSQVTEQRQQVQAANEQAKAQATQQAQQNAQQQSQQTTPNNPTTTPSTTPTTTPSTTTSNSGNSSSGSGTIFVPIPSVVSPLTAVTVGNPVVIKARAATTYAIKVFNGSDELGSAQGAGDAESSITLRDLPEGTYNLTVRSYLGSSYASASVALPAITVVEPGSVQLVYPTSNVTTSSPYVTVKASKSDTLIKVFNGETLVGSATGIANQDVTVPLALAAGSSYSNLYVAVEKSGIQSERSKINVTITVTSTGGAAKLTVEPGPYANGTAKAVLSLENFPQTSEFYALEVHLTYAPSKLKYSGPETLNKDNSTIFGAQAQSAETLKEYTGTTSNSELIYAASNYDLANVSSNITVDGKKTLVTIPLTVGTGAAADTTVPVTVVYYKIVNKSGATVLEVTPNNSITINIPVK